MLLGDPLSATPNQVTEILSAIRERKGLKKEIPELENYLDKL
jgi:hypothetical protein